MTREEILREYEAAVASHAAAAAAGIKGAAKSHELFKAGLDALRGPTREMVERMFSGCDICHEAPLEKIGLNEEEIYVVDGKEVPANESLRYCPRCGKPLSDEAVDMVMERLEALKDGL